MCRGKQYFILLDKTTNVCITLRPTLTFFFRDFTEDFNTLVIFSKTFFLIFVSFVDFSIQNNDDDSF
jgi:hypothetical protein